MKTEGNSALRNWSGGKRNGKSNIKIIRIQNFIAQKQKMSATDGEDKDIIALATDDTDAVVAVFFVRDGRLIGREHFFLRIPEGENRRVMLQVTAHNAVKSSTACQMA